MGAIDLREFPVTVEVVPPTGPDPEALLGKLREVGRLPITGFSVATNPVAKPHMSAFAFCSLLQDLTGKPAILHCTTRDHNRLSLQGLLWGAKAMGLDTVLAASGDRVALRERGLISSVGDLDVFELVGMAREAGLQTGVVLDHRPENDGLIQAVRRLERKVEFGAEFAVTQPLYDEASAVEVAEAIAGQAVPVIMGILPLRSLRHAEFLHDKVAGIAIPDQVRSRMEQADDAVAEGVAMARHMLALARDRFAGACIMPPFGHFEIMPELVEGRV